MNEDLTWPCHSSSPALARFGETAILVSAILAGSVVGSIVILVLWI